MRESIEDRIIAYFDGRLTDDESADLLHRVSVSPEIRRVFREHEMLREMAHSAQASAVVRPELEASIFSRIEAMAAAEQAPVAAEPVVEEEKKRRKAVPFFWSRWRYGLAAAAGAIVLGTAVTIGPELFSSDADDTRTASQQQMQSPSTESRGSQNAADAPVITPKDAITDLKEVAEEVERPAKQDFDQVIRGDRDYEARMVRNERRRAVGQTSVNTTDVTNSVDAKSLANNGTTNAAAVNTTGDLRPIASVAPKTSTPVAVGGEKNAPIFRAEDIDVERDHDDFELSLETSSGFSYPASGPDIQPLADHRLSMAYHLDANNLVGLRMTSGLYEALPENPTEVDARNYLSVTRNLDQERIFAPGLFYTHRFYGVFSPRISVDLSLAGNYLMRGDDDHSISAELGLRMPISDKISMIGTFSLTRVHIDADKMDEVVDEMTKKYDGPVLIEGSDVRNTINGRIHYGLSYQF